MALGHPEPPKKPGKAPYEEPMVPYVGTAGHRGFGHETPPPLRPFVFPDGDLVERGKLTHEELLRKNKAMEGEREAMIAEQMKRKPGGRPASEER